MLNYYEAAPNCLLTNSAAISCANNTLINVTFDTETRDLFSMHSTSVNTNRITIPDGLQGFYIFGASGVFAGNTAGRRFIQLLKNGSAVASSGIPAVVGNSMGLSVVSAEILAVGDYVALQAFQDSGGALNFTPTSFWAARVSR